MKKFSKVLATAALALSLGACSMTASPEDDAKNKSDLTLKEVFTNSQEADSELSSVHMDMELTQVSHDEAAEEGTMNMSTTSSTDLVMDPMTMYQTSSVNMTMDELEGSELPLAQVEMYLTEQEIYMKDNIQNEWTIVPNEMADLLKDAALQESSLPENQLKQLEPYLDDFTFKQDDDNFILQLSLEEEKADQLLKEGMALMGDELQSSFQGAMEDISLSKMDLKMWIDKESFHTVKMDITQKIEMTQDGKKVKVDQTMKSGFSKFNEIDSIEVPAEVTESAVEMESPFGQ
ncbi:hypothetical protein FZC79_16155 [Rossellomorea vietnamensis]|uniref:Lipoprotein n=1 Tax=Rossellomorea vietnamensis TaxID=218284 RepID=A0A5D4KB53_9BACI|nr:DUF6612 family protein [Rossellomorea vietnamensis]TYR73990.1 hypothetical protein FZC79_16155 [Rossellomorea vietnamensis]